MNASDRLDLYLNARRELGAARDGLERATDDLRKLGLDHSWRQASMFANQVSGLIDVLGREPFLDEPEA